MPAVDRVNRILLTMLGLLLLVGGVTGLAAGLGGLGDDIAERAVATNDTSDWLDRNGWFWWALAGLALLVGVLAVWWLLAQLRVARVGRVALEPESSDGYTELSGGALSAAVAADVERLPGVRRATTSVTGGREAPHVGVTADLDETARLPEVRMLVERETVPRLRHALGGETPVDVRLRLAPQSRRRVT